MGLTSGLGLNGLNFLIRHTEIIIPYLLVPTLCAFVSAFTLVGRIKPGKSWIFICILIVLMSLFLWACSIFFYFNNNEKWYGFNLAFLAATEFSWVLIPFGLIAGYFVLKLKKS
jgi:hypothetical protein